MKKSLLGPEGVLIFLNFYKREPVLGLTDCSVTVDMDI
jgi:hypothetical protein